MRSDILPVLRRFVRAHSGATAVEYAVLAAVLAGIVIGATGSIRWALQTSYANITAGVNQANSR